jgi:hypothetical protein
MQYPSNGTAWLVTRTCFSMQHRSFRYSHSVQYRVIGQESSKLQSGLAGLGIKVSKTVKSLRRGPYFQLMYECNTPDRKAAAFR